MNTALKEKEVPINYNPIFREHGLNLKSPNIKLITYCPWCGNKLPTSLRDIFFDILENEYNIEDGFLEILNNKKLPKEFQDDSWWEKRKL